MWSMPFPTTAQLAFAPLSPPPPPLPTLRPPPHPSTRSSLVDYLQTKLQPPPGWHREGHPSYDYHYPMTLILSYLPIATRRIVRIVSRSCCKWASTALPPLTGIMHIEVPATTLTTPELRALEQPAQQCRQLTLTFLHTPSTTEVPSPELTTLPDFPKLETLRIKFPPVALTKSQLSAIKMPAQQCRHLTITFHTTPSRTEAPTPKEPRIPVFPKLTNLHIEYPDIGMNAYELAMLQESVKECRHLTITFPSISSSTLGPSPEGSKFLELADLTHLHLVCPNFEVFDRLLAFRHTLQASKVPKMRHLTIADLTIAGITALRWGGFTSLGSSTWPDQKVWRDLTGLDLSVISWCDNMQPTPFSYKHMDEAQKDTWCTGLKILHDWLHSFATVGNLRVLKFAWQGAEGPNPLLLEKVAEAVSRHRWFSAPAIRWSALKEVWLRGVRLGLEDVRSLTKNIPGLEALMVEGRLVGDGVRGVRTVADGKEWCEIFVGGEPVELEGDIPEMWDVPEEDSHAPDIGERVANGEDVISGDAMGWPVELDNTPVRGSRRSGWVFR